MKKLNYGVAFFLVVLMVAVGLQHCARWQKLTGRRGDKRSKAIFFLECSDESSEM
jgi:hypothetical protein